MEPRFLLDVLLFTPQHCGHTPKIVVQYAPMVCCSQTDYGQKIESNRWHKNDAIIIAPNGVSLHTD